MRSGELDCILGKVSTTESAVERMAKNVAYHFSPTEILTVHSLLQSPALGSCRRERSPRRAWARSPKFIIFNHHYSPTTSTFLILFAGHAYPCSPRC